MLKIRGSINWCLERKLALSCILILVPPLLWIVSHLFIYIWTPLLVSLDRQKKWVWDSNGIQNGSTVCLYPFHKIDRKKEMSISEKDLEYTRSKICFLWFILFKKGCFRVIKVHIYCTMANISLNIEGMYCCKMWVIAALIHEIKVQ